MRILVATLGSYGDVYPFIALETGELIEAMLGR